MAEANPTPHFLAPMLLATDFQATVKFYQSVLGLPVRGAAPYAECRTSSSLLSIFDAKFMTQTGELDVPVGGALAAPAATVLAIEVDDLEEVFERLAVTGTRFLSSPSSRIPLGRKYAFLRDPDGRTVALLGPRTTPEE